jgi:hypothetical protein
MYAMVITRPNIDYIMSKIASYQAQPQMSHWIALKHIIWYLKHIQTHGIRYFGDIKNFKLIGYSNTDYRAEFYGLSNFQKPQYSLLNTNSHQM